MKLHAAALALSALGLCAPAAPAQEVGTPAARATLMDADGAQVGVAEFIPTPVGVLIRAELEGLPPGAHGFHIHETGKCEPPFESAGEHYNPTGAEHGFFVPEGPHTGDMSNIDVPESGALTLEAINPFIRAEAGDILDEDGSALIIHADADDYHTQPSGSAGDPIACGVIEAAG